MARTRNPKVDLTVFSDEEGRMTGGAAIAAQLALNGVDTVFGLPGVQTYELFEGLRRGREYTKLIGARHEQATAYMAYGYAKSTGRVGVYTVVPGPGLLNASAAMLTGHSATAPMLAITGQVPSGFIGGGRRHLHEMPDQLATMRSFIKGAERIGHPVHAPAAVQDALALALSGRPGGVSLEMAWDTMSQKANVSFDRSLDQSKLVKPSSIDAHDVDDALALIKAAKHPMIFVGGGALSAAAEINALASRIGVPVAAHRGGRGIVSEVSDLGMPGYPAFKLWPKVDLAIGIGTRMEMPYLRWDNYLTNKPRPADPKLIRIDIDPDEMARLCPDVAIVGDAGDAVASLLEAIERDGMCSFKLEEAARAAKAEAFQEMREKMQPQMGFLDVIRDLLPQDSYFVEELSQLGFASWVGYPVVQPRTYISSGAQGTLGFGFMTALGVKAAHPDKPVVSITGDGGLMFGIQEFASAVEHGLGVVTILVNNGGYANVRRDQTMRFDGAHFKADFYNPDFRKLADAFGVPHYAVTDPAGLKRVLPKALGESGPTLIEIKLDRGSEAAPWPFLHPHGFEGK